MASPRGLAFVIDAVGAPTRVQPAAAALPFSGRASWRLRALLPARELAASRPVFLVPSSEAIRDPALSDLGPLDGVIAAKLLAAGDLVARPAAAARITDALRALAAHHRLLIDVCDDLIAQSDLAGHPGPGAYLDAIGGIAPLVVPTATLAASVRAAARHGVTVIEDCYEGPAGMPRGPRSDGDLRLCWFGEITRHSQAPLDAAMRMLAARPDDRRIRLAIVANPNAAAWARSAAPQGLGVIFIPWSPEATWRTLGDCDAVLLPQDWTAPWARAKSHNRLVESIRAGRVAIAHPTPAYRELAAFACVGDDLMACLDAAIADPDEMAARLARGQAAIATRFSPAAVAHSWVEALRRVGRP